MADDAASPASGSAIRQRGMTIATWVTGLALIAASYIVVISPLTVGVRGAVHAPEEVREGLNQLGLLVALPVGAIVLVVLGVLCWVARRYLSLTTARGVALLVLLPLAVLVPLLLWAQNLVDPVSLWKLLANPLSVLLLVLPATFTALYAAFSHRPTLMSILGVAVLALGVGMFAFASAGLLVGAETD